MAPASIFAIYLTEIGQKMQVTLGSWAGIFEEILLTFRM